MFKSVHREIWAFDAEWIPDPAAGRLLYGLPQSTSDKAVMEEMWRQGGATEDNPRPYLKTVLCRVVSISALIRKVQKDSSVSLELLSLPRNFDNELECSENYIIQRFLNGIGKNRPQLVGYNSSGADLRILIQRGITTGISAPGFCERPNKPWEGVDYFAKDNDYNIDLMTVLSPWGRAPSLHEIATLSGIPGKMETDGDQVAELWLNGDLASIVAYNECDALTTYLIWLRTAHFGGHFTTENYEREEILLRELVEGLSAEPGRSHLKRYVQVWDSLRGTPR